MFPIFVFSQSDTIFNTTGEIISINQKGVDKLVSKYKQILKKTGGIDGWRIQLIFKGNEALKIKHQISKNFPGAYPVPIIIDPNLLED